MIHKALAHCPFHPQRRQLGEAPTKYTFPRGVLTRLLMAHIQEGQRIMTKRHGRVHSLFVSGHGHPFTSASNFSQYWSTLIRQHAPKSQRKLTAQLARTMYLEHFTSVHGSQPMDIWEGCAVIMGNRTTTWAKNYTPGERRPIHTTCSCNHCQCLSPHCSRRQE
jgi:hypothetical protein